MNYLKIYEAYNINDDSDINDINKSIKDINNSIIWMYYNFVEKLSTEKYSYSDTEGIDNLLFIHFTKIFKDINNAKNLYDVFQIFKDYGINGSSLFHNYGLKDKCFSDTYSASPKTRYNKKIDSTSSDFNDEFMKLRNTIYNIRNNKINKSDIYTYDHVINKDSKFRNEKDSELYNFFKYYFNGLKEIFDDINKKYNLNTDYLDIFITLFYYMYLTGAGESTYYNNLYMVSYNNLVMHDMLLETFINYFYDISNRYYSTREESHNSHDPKKYDEYLKDMSIKYKDMGIEYKVKMLKFIKEKMLSIENEYKKLLSDKNNFKNFSMRDIVKSKLYKNTFDIVLDELRKDILESYNKNSYSI